MVLRRLNRRMSLDDLARLIFGSTPELVGMMEAGGAKLGCMPLGFLNMWYLKISFRLDNNYLCFSVL
jgi:hypothetical protein